MQPKIHTTITDNTAEITVTSPGCGHVYLHLENVPLENIQMWKDTVKKEYRECLTCNLEYINPCRGISGKMSNSAAIRAVQGI